MSTNETKGRPGRTMQVTAPTGGLTGGDLYAIRSGTGGFCGVVVETKAATLTAVIEFGHQVKVNKNTGTGESGLIGALVYRDASTGKLTTTATGNDLAGALTAAMTTADTTAWVQLGASA